MPSAKGGGPSMIIIGDSVSIGYTPVVTTLLAGAAGNISVQHSPWAGGGGADDVANGVSCERYFIRTAMYQNASWDLISFNFGLHNLNNATSAEEVYEELLGNFTMTLRTQQPKAQLVYVTTTPQMQYRYLGNMVVEDLNRRARTVMSGHAIPVLDLYQRVIDKCGAVYKNCSICDDEYNPQTGITCGYHYNAAGWEYLGEFLAPLYRKMLKP